MNLPLPLNLPTRYRASLNAGVRLQQQLDKLRANGEEQQARRQLLTYQLEELETLALAKDELEQLRARTQELKQFRKSAGKLPANH